MSEHEVYIFDADPKRVVSVTVGELQELLTDPPIERRYDFLSDSAHTRVRHAFVRERTCHVDGEYVSHEPTVDALKCSLTSFVCSSCGMPFYMADVCCDPEPSFCPHCGARVVSE